MNCNDGQVEKGESGESWDMAYSSVGHGWEGPESDVFTFRTFRTFPHFPCFRFSDKCNLKCKICPNPTHEFIL